MKYINKAYGIYTGHRCLDDVGIYFSHDLTLNLV